MTTAPFDHLFARPFTLNEALLAGLSKKRLRSMAHARVLRRVLHGVYRHSDLTDDLAMRLRALALVTPPDVVVCGRTAAWLYGVDTFDFAELEVLPVIETCVAPTASRPRRIQVTGHRYELTPRDITRMDGLLVMTQLRTAVELGMTLRRRPALAALDQFLRIGGFRPKELEIELGRFTGRRGIVQLRELAPLADGRAESSGESWVRLALIDAGLPAPEPQVWVTINGQPLYRLDHGYRKHRVGVEYDGVEFHDSEEDRTHDEARRRWLSDQGWIIVVVRKDDFTSDAVEHWTRRVREALDSRHR